MAYQNFKGRVWLKDVGHSLEVSTSASSPSSAAKIIKGVYGNLFKSFAKQMSRK